RTAARAWATIPRPTSSIAGAFHMRRRTSACSARRRWVPAARTTRHSPCRRWRGARRSISRRTGTGSRIGDRRATFAERARARAKLVPERAVEIRDVAEPGIERHVENLRPLPQQPRGGFAEAHPANVLMWREAGQPFKGSKKVVRAQASLVGEVSQAKCVL